MIKIGLNINRFSSNQVLSFITCSFYLFYSFIGISGPKWHDRVLDPYEVVTSNFENQVVMSLIFILTLLSILINFKKVIEWFNQEKYIIFFFAWCALTFLWSQDPVVSAKRYLQYITTSLVFISVLVNFKNENTILNILLVIMPIYLLINFGAVLTNSLAIDPLFGTFRGIHVNKNVLGQTAGLNVLLFGYLTIWYRKYAFKLLSAFFLGIAVFLLIGSQSGTSIISVTIICLIILSTNIDKVFLPLGIRNKLSIFFWILFSAVIIIFLVFYSDIVFNLFYAIGKDPSFTGRTDLWLDLLVLARENIFVGFGYQAFWIPTSTISLYLYEFYTWLPNQAHNGYIDIILEIGLIGLILFILMILKQAKNCLSNNNLLWVLFILFTLLLNFQESTVLRPHHFTNVFFFMSFWAISFKSHFNNNLSGELYDDQAAIS